MGTRAIPLLLLTAALMMLAGCSPLGSFNFTGRVYDGASGNRLMDYSIRAEYWRESIAGQVDGSGRYTLGSIPEGQDFTVVIEAEGYRSFMAHTALFEDATPERTESLYFDAYLFPEGLPSPEVRFHINLPEPDVLAEGVIRLEPTTSSSLYSESSEPVGISDGSHGRQLWRNDDDLQFRAVTRAFSDGQVTFAEGELVYGVTYAVTVLDVDGYADLSRTYTSGSQGDQAWTLNPEGYSSLQLVFASPSLDLWNSEGLAVLIFNQPIAYYAEGRINDYLEAVDDATTIDSPDADGDGSENLLNFTVDDELVQERGTSITITGNQLQLGWSLAGLEVADGDDPIHSVTYGGLYEVELVAADGPVTNRSSLGSLLGSSNLTVELLP
ncbi:MAG: hypothetical protein CMP23_08030 [Rickettsiales bacterium]|nr:hypothetical protein [Rickettsiales bacterium]|tara:strand:- start:125 stop:1276 length:1152 start_codon:yes stop_codon:yes gene_type:complete